MLRYLKISKDLLDPFRNILKTIQKLYKKNSPQQKCIANNARLYSLETLKCYFLELEVNLSLYCRGPDATINFKK